MDDKQQAVQQVEVVDIQFRPGQKIYFFSPNGERFLPGDHVIIDTARGAEFGYCTAGNHTIPGKDVVSPLRSVLRRANPQDERIHQDNQAREERAFEVCLGKIEEHKLDMQLVSAECAFDGSKILFYFTADERVDFRELVKNLASVFHTRIELRQIGVRDKAKMVGGLGICGRPFCCASFLDDFQPVSIKMAKTQNLSLNPTKISGTCGRLMCCLKYEQDAYEDLIRSSPKQDSFVDTPEGRGTVIDVDLMRQRVKVRMEQSTDTVGWFANVDIAVLRNGKAKKHDPPIPADLAPISGNGKRLHKEETQERAFLDPIRFRYSTESVVEEPAPEPQAVPEETREPKEPKSRSRRRSRKPQAEQAAKPEQTQEPKPEKKEKPAKPPKLPKQQPQEAKQAQEPKPQAEAGTPSHKKRRHYRSRKPKNDGNG